MVVQMAVDLGFETGHHHIVRQAVSPGGGGLNDQLRCGHKTTYSETQRGECSGTNKVTIT